MKKAQGTSRFECSALKKTPRANEAYAPASKVYRGSKAEIKTMSNKMGK